MTGLYLIPTNGMRESLLGVGLCGARVPIVVRQSNGLWYPWTAYDDQWDPDKPRALVLLHVAEFSPQGWLRALEVMKYRNDRPLLRENYQLPIWEAGVVDGVTGWWLQEQFFATHHQHPWAALAVVGEQLHLWKTAAAP